MFFFSTVSAETHNCEKNKVQKIKLYNAMKKITFSDNGIFLNLKNGPLSISSLSYDQINNTFYGIFNNLQADGVCPFGHPYYPDLGGCTRLSCPFYWDN